MAGRAAGGVPGLPGAGGAAPAVYGGGCRWVLARVLTQGAQAIMSCCSRQALMFITVMHVEGRSVRELAGICPAHAYAASHPPTCPPARQPTCRQAVAAAAGGAHRAHLLARRRHLVSWHGESVLPEHWKAQGASGLGRASGGCVAVALQSRVATPSGGAWRCGLPSCPVSRSIPSARTRIDGCSVLPCC